MEIVILHLEEEQQMGTYHGKLVSDRLLPILVVKVTKKVNCTQQHGVQQIQTKHLKTGTRKNGL